MRLKLRRLRRERDITQQALAEKINVKQNTISGWEKSRKIPPFDKCMAIASVLGVSVFDLIEEETTDVETCAPAPPPGTPPGDASA